MTSIKDPTSESDESSILSSSSDDDDNNTSDTEPKHPTTGTKDEDIPTITSKRKPPIQPIPASTASGLGALKGRLKSFLPALKAANEETLALQKNGKGTAAGQGGGRGGAGLELEEVNEGQEYISMELGLGVLEHKGDSSSTDSDSEADSSGEEEGREANGKEKHVMATLKGQDKHAKTKEKPGITEIS